MQSFLGWIGGKRALRSKIIDRLPADAGRYIEVFGGAGWVLFGRDPSPGQLEVFNDYDSDLINIYRCVKYHPEELKKELAILPDSRELFFDFQTQEHMRGLTDIQRAARSLYLIKVSFGSDRGSFATSSKIVSNISSYFDAVQARLRKVVIENLDFEKLIRVYDRENAIFYCDPPYMGTESYYRAQFESSDHVRLSRVLHGIKGKFLLSYNDCSEVRELYADCYVEPLVRTNQLAATGPTEYKEVLIRNYL